jgi:hypothetical protein
MLVLAPVMFVIAPVGQQFHVTHDRAGMHLWLTTKQVCKLLQVDERTLRKYETPDGRWCTLFGLKFRVYRYGSQPQSQRRYSEAEIQRIVEQINTG